MSRWIIRVHWPKYWAASLAYIGGSNVELYHWKHARLKYRAEISHRIELRPNAMTIMKDNKTFVALDANNISSLRTKNLVHFNIGRTCAPSWFFDYSYRALVKNRKIYGYIENLTKCVVSKNVHWEKNHWLDWVHLVNYHFLVAIYLSI